ncbi:helix-turn-helix domain-containing protein [Candidatus Microgenomates bacterium]|nr:helix-turn-helix domain-containing protein [Candidatus Microgenomates bacterium]
MTRKPTKRLLGVLPAVPFSRGLGKTFSQRRRELGLSMAQMAAETKIQVRWLKALEQGDYQALAHTVHTVGFVRRYAKTLGLSGQTAVAKYLLERGPLPGQPRQIKRQRVQRSLIGSRLLLWSGLGIVIVAVVAYLFWQLSVLARPPQLSIASPQENQLLTQLATELDGQTTTGAEVLVNGQTVYVDEQGRFTTSLNLATGINVITVEARNSRGQTTRRQLTVLVEPH